MSDAEVIWSLLISRIEVYRKVYNQFKLLKLQLCDLKLALNQHGGQFRCLAGFCWNKFDFIYQEVTGNIMPKSASSSDLVAKGLWVVAEAIFHTDQLEECREFLDLFVDAREVKVRNKINFFNSVESSVCKKMLT